MYAAGGPIAWQSKLQTTIAVLTMAAEYMAAFGAIQELIWTNGVLGEISFDYVGPMILHIDSQSAMHSQRIRHTTKGANISYSVGVLARFSKNPNYRPCKALLFVLVYLRGTSEKGIRYTGTNEPVCICVL